MSDMLVDDVLMRSWLQPMPINLFYLVTARSKGKCVQVGVRHHKTESRVEETAPRRVDSRCAEDIVD